MAAINVTLNGVIVDLYGRVISGPVKIMGELMYSDRNVGGGPIIPPGGGGGGSPGDPPGIWGGPIDPYPDHGLPGPQPHPEHPIVIPPTEPPEGPSDDNGFIKPPPEGGGWAYHETYGWMYDPPSNKPGPK